MFGAAGVKGFKALGLRSDIWEFERPGVWNGVGVVRLSEPLLRDSDAWHEGPNPEKRKSRSLYQQNVPSRGPQSTGLDLQFLLHHARAPSLTAHVGGLSSEIGDCNLSYKPRHKWNTVPTSQDLPGGVQVDPGLCNPCHPQDRVQYDNRPATNAATQLNLLTKQQRRLPTNSRTSSGSWRKASGPTQRRLIHLHP